LANASTSNLSPPTSWVSGRQQTKKGRKRGNAFQFLFGFNPLEGRELATDKQAARVKKKLSTAISIYVS